MPQTVLAFDYSGTLSLAMASFGERRILAKALSESGLGACGVTVDRYWQDVVGATWAEAAVGRDTAVALFRRCIEAQPWYTGNADSAEPMVAALIAAYLASAEVWSYWAPVLQQALATPDQTVVVATDHYAEATDAVVGHLGRLGVAATPIRQQDGGGGVFVVNSSDMGHTKRSPGFWQALVRHLGAASAPSLILVDDFRANEPTAAPGARAAVTARRDATIHAAETAFSRVEGIVFKIDRADPSTWLIGVADVKRQIDAAVTRFHNFGTG